MFKDGPRSQGSSAAAAGPCRKQSPSSNVAPDSWQWDHIRVHLCFRTRMRVRRRGGRIANLQLCCKNNVLTGLWFAGNTPEKDSRGGCTQLISGLIYGGQRRRGKFRKLKIIKSNNGE